MLCMSLPLPLPMNILVSVVMGAWREAFVLAGAEFDVAVAADDDVAVTNCGGVRCTK